MGAYDGAEVCELVGSFIFYALSLKYYKTNIGRLKRDEMSSNGDDRLAVLQFLEILSARTVRKLKKEFQKLFQQLGLKLIIKCNLEIADFLDLTLNLTFSRFLKFNQHKLSLFPVLQIISRKCMYFNI